jgi:hypothetical protein
MHICQVVRGLVECSQGEAGRLWRSIVTYPNKQSCLKARIDWFSCIDDTRDITGLASVVGTTNRGDRAWDRLVLERADPCPWADWTSKGT